MDQTPMQQPAAKFYQNSSRIKIALITVIVAIVGGLIVYLFTPQKSRDLDYPYNGNGSVTFKEEQQLAMAMFTPPDSDEDGLSDALEIQIGSKIFSIVFKRCLFSNNGIIFSGNIFFCL